MGWVSTFEDIVRRMESDLASIEVDDEKRQVSVPTEKFLAISRVCKATIREFRELIDVAKDTALDTAGNYQKLQIDFQRMSEEVEYLRHQLAAARKSEKEARASAAVHLIKINSVLSENKMLRERSTIETKNQQDTRNLVCKENDNLKVLIKQRDKQISRLEGENLRLPIVNFEEFRRTQEQWRAYQVPPTIRVA